MAHFCVENCFLFVSYLSLGFNVILKKIVSIHVLNLNRVGKNYQFHYIYSCLIWRLNVDINNRMNLLNFNQENAFSKGRFAL